MARLKKHLLNEENTELTDDDLNKIKAHSKQWLRAIKKCSGNKNNAFFRGMLTTKPFFKKETRTDRKPKDTSARNQYMANLSFKKHWGWKARSEAIFGTGNFDVSQEYGYDVYVIFPIGPFKVLWSSIIKDFYADVVYDVVDNDSIENKTIDDTIRTKYQEGNLCKALQSGNEIMIKAKNYYAVRFNDIERFLGTKGHEYYWKIDKTIEAFYKYI